MSSSENPDHPGLAAPLAETSENDLDKISLIVFSGELDRALAALNIANGALAMNYRVSLFFTFWGTTILTGKPQKWQKKNFLQKLFNISMVRGPKKRPLSQMNFGGLGSKMMNSLMQQKNIPSLEEMLSLAQEQGAKLYVCQMSMDLMGIERSEILPLPDLEYCGVAGFLEQARPDRHTMFI